MGSTGASVLKILRNANAPVGVVTSVAATRTDACPLQSRQATCWSSKAGNPPANVGRFHLTVAQKQRITRGVADDEPTACHQASEAARKARLIRSPALASEC